MRMRSALTIACLASLVAASQAQVLLGGFEQSPATGWEVENGNSLTTFEYSNTTGVTQGSWSAKAQIVVTSAGGFKLAFKNFSGEVKDAMFAGGALAQAGSTLSASITMPTSSYSNIIYSEGILAIAYRVTGSSTEQFISNVTPITAGTTSTMTWTLPVVPTIEAGGYFGIFIGLNINPDVTNGTSEVFFDNVTFTPVPEPMTMTVLALGTGLAAMARRRRKS